MAAKRLPGGTFTMAEDLTVTRMGHGAMHTAPVNHALPPTRMPTMPRAPSPEHQPHRITTSRYCGTVILPYRRPFPWT